MTIQQMLEYLRLAQAKPGDKLINLVTIDKWLFKVGNGAPSGTPDAKIYINLTGTTTTTVVYVDVNGTWTALTIS